MNTADFFVDHNPQKHGMAIISEGLAVPHEGASLPFSLVLPAAEPRGKGHPLIIFLQGSGWTAPNRFYQLPQLCRYAQSDLAVAAITHRNSLDGHPFPTYLKDAKAAIRYLRQHAGEFGLDPERFAFFGTSSGGNTALLVGLTADDPRYAPADYPGISDRVSAVVDCFGPTDMLDFEGNPLGPALLAGQQPPMEEIRKIYEKNGAGELFEIISQLVGQGDLLGVLKDMSPLRQIRKGQDYPPFLIAQGDGDSVVPLSQSLRMHQALKEHGYKSSLIQVRGGEHEGNFWSHHLHGMIYDFLDKQLRPDAKK